MLSLWCSEHVNSWHTCTLNSNSTLSTEDFHNLAKTTFSILAPMIHLMYLLATHIPNGICTPSLEQFTWFILFLYKLWKYLLLPSDSFAKFKHTLSAFLRIHLLVLMSLFYILGLIIYLLWSYHYLYINSSYAC